jgi:hypothetical protein
MSDYKVGYGKPPVKSRFKRGVSANPAGRPRRRAPDLGEIIQNVLHATSPYRENGKTKRAPRYVVAINALVKRAVSGDIKCAEELLKLRAYAQKYGDGAVRRIRLHDWVPDYPGQTGEQKTHDLAMGGETASANWWQAKTGNNGGTVI